MKASRLHRPDMIKYINYALFSADSTVIIMLVKTQSEFTSHMIDLNGDPLRPKTESERHLDQYAHA